MHVTKDDGKSRTHAGQTPEDKFGDILRRVREASGRTQESVAEAMRKLGFAEYSQMHVSRTERGNRPLRLNEAVALARILDVDLLGAFVGAVAGEAGQNAAIAERVAFVKVLDLTGQVTTAQQQRKDLQRRIPRLEAELAEAEEEWQQAVERMNRLTQKGAQE